MPQHFQQDVIRLFQLANNGKNSILSGVTRVANFIAAPSDTELLQLCPVDLDVGHTEEEAPNNSFHYHTAIRTMVLLVKESRAGFRAIQVVGLLLASLSCLSGQTHSDGSSAVASPALSVVPGQLVFGKNGFIEYVIGNLPIIISVPHGGNLKPENIPNRDLGTPGRQDTGTQELAREIVECFRQQTGKFPHVIINRLHREKLDANRELFDAALDDPIAGEAWSEFHAYIDSAQHRVTREFGKGLYVDLHGHRHDWQAVELGYLLVSSQLNLSDAELDATVSSATTSVGLAWGTKLTSLSRLIRGPESLGAALEQQGFPTVPSPAHPNPNGKPYFSGGYNLEQHGSFSGRPMFGVQIETPMNLRESDEQRKAFGRALAKGILVLLKELAF